jgi:hypothetical protein
MNGREDRTGEEEQADTEEDTNHYLAVGKDLQLFSSKQDYRSIQFRSFF